MMEGRKSRLNGMWVSRKTEWNEAIWEREEKGYKGRAGGGFWSVRLGRESKCAGSNREVSYSCGEESWEDPLKLVLARSPCLLA